MPTIQQLLRASSEDEKIFTTMPEDFDPGYLCDHDDEEYFELLENGMFDDESETAQKGYDNPIAVECDRQDLQDCAGHLGAVVVG